MARFDERTLAIVKRLQRARLSLMQKQPFYALLLMNMKFSIDLTCNTAYTDGERVAFAPDFMDEIDDSELEFVLMHEVLHAALAHPMRHLDEYSRKEFDIACDIVVNSNILYSFGMDKSKITLKKYGESMHLLPNGKEGYLYSVEDAYKMLLAVSAKRKDSNGDGDGSADSDGEDEGDGNGNGNGKGKNKGKSKGNSDGSSSFDDHSHWNGEDDMGAQAQAWMNRMIEATDIIASIEGNTVGRGTVPLLAERAIKELKNPTLDWRTILNDFVQEEICDYSFAPPDKRMEDSPFFLPDFNEKDETVKNLLFMVDTSGSMSDRAISDCYSEIYGAIQQFNGKLAGKLGFFDAKVVEPKAFEDEEELKIIRPKGGGGTSFHVIFDYVRDNMQEDLPVSIIILTDGYAPFPSESAALGIPVLWVINNGVAEAPKWGKVARMV